jgi:hypothetical protein
VQSEAKANGFSTNHKPPTRPGSRTIWN